MGARRVLAAAILRAACAAILRAACAAILLAACRGGSGEAALDAGGDGGLWGEAQPEPEPRPGMAWIPSGVLYAGTPLDKLPRVADEEMAGEQVVMHGFYVDVFPWPNEPGAIPTTNLSLDEARGLCEGQGKRLCTELELERACKGPDNLAYEYGDAYKAAVCGTGTLRTLIPNGYNAACQSAFGVHDLHGGAWSWTASQWRRDPAKANLVTARGGNGPVGELVGRCANGRGLRADARREDVGVRCCAGEPNTFEVVLSVTRGEPLHWQPAEDRIAPQLEKLVPEEVAAAARGRRAEDRFKIERLWTWHPLGNEELWVGGGCEHPGEHAACGVVVARMRFETPVSLAWVSSDWWQPTLVEADTARELYLQGGDRNGAFRRRVSYAWGRIAVGDKERKKKRKGQKDPTY
jgi:sulfatase modifying factor 1